MPVLLLLSMSSLEYILHSGDKDSILSCNTMPHSLQTTSLLSASYTIALLLHKLHSSLSKDTPCSAVFITLLAMEKGFGPVHLRNMCTIKLRSFMSVQKDTQQWD